MSLYWIAVAATGPTLLAFLAAWPCWLKVKDVMVGNVVGTLIVMASVFALIGREYITIERARRRCEALTGAVCAGNTVGAFTTFAIYGCIAFAEVIALFMVGGAIEHRRQRSLYSPEWR